MGNEYYAEIITRPGFSSGMAFVKFVRHTDQDPNMEVVNTLFSKYIEEPTSRKTVELQQRAVGQNEVKDRQKSAEDERNRKTNAAKE